MIVVVQIKIDEFCSIIKTYSSQRGKCRYSQPYLNLNRQCDYCGADFGLERIFAFKGLMNHEAKAGVVDDYSVLSINLKRICCIRKDSDWVQRQKTTRKYPKKTLPWNLICAHIHTQLTLLCS
jgi:hypothetical protein